MNSVEEVVAWSDLDISRQSILGLWEGKHILATTPFHEAIFLGFGHDKYESKVVFILQQTGETWFRICDNDYSAKELATKVAYDLMKAPSLKVMDFYLFEKVG